MTEINRFLKLLSGYKVLAKVESPINGDIEVVKQFGEISITAGGLTQSGEPIKYVWGKTVGKIPRNFSGKVLILGLGSGTLAYLLYKRCRNLKITGIEIDPLMVELGKKYLDLGKIKDLIVNIHDAADFCNKQIILESKYDYIFVDVYVGGKIPKQMDSEKFYKNLSKLIERQGRIFINRLFYTPETKESAQKTITILEKAGFSIRLSRVFTNLILELSNRSA
jgi:spermidine synthase